MPTRLLVGINDTALYHVGKEGKIFGVEKKEYSIPGEMVFLSRDTIELGDDFYAHFGVDKDQFEILVSKPTFDTLTRADYDKLEKDEGLGYTFKTTQKGIFEFEGQISYDTVIRPFKWKFIVVEND
jgi:hypothetical protein